MFEFYVIGKEKWVEFELMRGFIFGLKYLERGFSGLIDFGFIIYKGICGWKLFLFCTVFGLISKILKL